jgi:hypothetical protein
VPAIDAVGTVDWAPGRLRDSAPPCEAASAKHFQVVCALTRCPRNGGRATWNRLVYTVHLPRLSSDNQSRPFQVRSCNGKSSASSRNSGARQGRPADPVFFDSHADVPQPMIDEAVDQHLLEAMLKAGIHPALIYANQKTGRILTQEIQKSLSPADRQVWQDAIDEWSPAAAEPRCGRAPLPGGPAPAKAHRPPSSAVESERRPGSHGTRALRLNLPTVPPTPRAMESP